jgi:hypothetical protein
VEQAVAAAAEMHVSVTMQCSTAEWCTVQGMLHAGQHAARMPEGRCRPSLLFCNENLMILSA